MLEQLSTDGVTSEIASEADPDRLIDYKNDAATFYSLLITVDQTIAQPLFYNETAIDRAKSCISSSKVNGDASDGVRTCVIQVLERMIQILETNSHADADGENCGLWLLGSIIEHSCRPNATAVLHFNDDGAVLELRCVRKILENERISISYTDEEYLPTAVRRETLLLRGFLCECDLCLGKMLSDGSPLYDASRPICCPQCFSGICVPAGPSWHCLLCNRVPNAEFIDRVEMLELSLEQQEESLVAHVVSIIEILFSENLILHQLLENKNPERNCVVEAISITTPLHPTHQIYYSFVKLNLFQNTQRLLNAFSGSCVPRELVSLFCCAYLVYCGHQYASISKMPPLEDLRHHLVWLWKLFRLPPVVAYLSSPTVGRWCVEVLDQCFKLTCILYGPSSKMARELEFNPMSLEHHFPNILLD